MAKSTTALKSPDLKSTAKAHDSAVKNQVVAEEDPPKKSKLNGKNENVGQIDLRFYNNTRRRL